MSKVENPVDDAKKLAQRCKALEAQLRQTITKKEHHEIVLEFEDRITGMEKTISSQDRKIADQEKELARDRAELQRDAGLGKQIADLGAQAAAIGKVAEAQGRTIDSLLFKVSQGTVPAAVHQQSLSKVRELEEQVDGMVSRSEYASLQRRYEEATRQLNGMVPSSDHEALKARVQEFERTVSTMVPRDQLESSEETVRDLKAKLAERVPQSTYDELVSKVVQLAEEVTGGEPPLEEQEITEQTPAPTETEQPPPTEPRPTARPEIPVVPAPLQAAKAEAASASPAPVPAVPQAELPEIREVGTHLAELKTDVLETKPEINTTAKPIPAQKPTPEKARSELTFTVTSVPSESSSQDSAGQVLED